MSAIAGRAQTPITTDDGVALRCDICGETATVQCFDDHEGVVARCSTCAVAQHALRFVRIARAGLDAVQDALESNHPHRTAGARVDELHRTIRDMEAVVASLPGGPE